jgi:dephospho-CoA kinase
MSFVIGLTGGIGSGKTEALQEFSRLGARTISLDQIAREQALPGGPAYQGILRSFGRKILDAEGTINRPRLARLVFSSLKMKRKLERLTHPLILKEMRRQILGASGIVIVDVPLLFEGRQEKNFAATFTVSAPKALRFRRAARRDGVPLSEIQRRAFAQTSESERLRRADVVIFNDGSRSQFRETIGEYWQALKLTQQNSRQEIPEWKS